MQLHSSAEPKPKNNPTGTANATETIAEDHSGAPTNRATATFKTTAAKIAGINAARKVSGNADLPARATNTSPVLARKTRRPMPLPISPPANAPVSSPKKTIPHDECTRASRNAMEAALEIAAH